ncbi:MAG: hypothetical protein EBR81_01040 [Proteobacteria bacterium]|nr:hypothetical protein [Pseudomonadota bacterium]
MQLVPFNEMQQMAEAIAGSGLFGLKTPQQALALGLLCQAEGRHPAEAARDYHVIQGRPTLKADTMLARFQSAGGRVEWPVYSDKKARVISEAIRTILPGVLSGCYLPDELPEVPLTATVTAEPTLSLPLGFDIAAAVATLNASETIDDLRNAWASVIQSAPPEALAELTAAKDNRKAELV